MSKFRYKWGAQKKKKKKKRKQMNPFQNMRTYPTMMKLGSFTLPKEDPIIFESRDTTHEFCWHQHFFTGNQEVNFFWVFKDCFNKHGYNSDDVRKMTTPDVLKVTVFWSKGYDLIISAHDVSNKNFIT